jgi:hypothetical protein
VVDARTLRTLCTHSLEPGVRYSSLLLGRSGTVYAIGVRRVERGRWNSVLTMADAETGELAGSQTLREADLTPRVRFAKDWWPYWTALSDDERRLVVSYHGGDTTGADTYRVSPGSGVERDGVSEGRCPSRTPRWGCETDMTDVGWAHGAVEAAGRGFVAASGGEDVLRVGRRGGETGRLHLRGHLGHLMAFELDAGRRFLYVSACGARPGILRTDLAGAGRRMMLSGDFCGTPLALHANRFLLLAASRVTRLGFPSFREEGLRLLDLERPGAGRPIPRSAGALDAVVVGSRR